MQMNGEPIPDDFRNFLQEIVTSTEGFLFVINSSGNIIAAGEKFQKTIASNEYLSKKELTISDVFSNDDNSFLDTFNKTGAIRFPDNLILGLKNQTGVLYKVSGKKLTYGKIFDGYIITMIKAQGGTDETALNKLIYKISESAYKVQDLQALYRYVHKLIGELIPAKNFYIAQYHKDLNKISFPYFIDEIDGVPTNSLPPQDYANSLTDYMLRLGRPMLVDQKKFDELVEQGEVKLYGENSSEWLGAPLRTPEGVIVGAIVVQNYDEKQQYSEEHVAMLDFISTQIAMAIARKQYEKNLEASEERFRRIVEQSPYGIVIHRQGKIVFANNAAKDILRATAVNEVEGMPVLDFVHPSYRELVMQRVSRLHEEGENPEMIQEKFICLDGSVIDVEVSAVKVSFQGEDATQTMFHDISERIRVEAKIKQYIEELKKSKTLLEKNASDLRSLNSQLEESERQLKKMNASKDKFFSIIAHDLRNPFISLLGYSEFLANDLDELDPYEIKKFADSIYRASRSIFGLLENLLQWSRVQSGKIPFHPEKLSLKAAVEDIIELYKGNIQKKQIRLENTISETLDVRADKNMLHTVLRNLLSNAVKFTKAEGKVAISAKNEDTFVTVRIEDSGIGMDEDMIRKLFDLGDSVIRQGTDDEPGTGLGLILCKEFIQKMGGEISVESELQKGTVFSFTLPLFEKSIAE